MARANATRLIRKRLAAPGWRRQRGVAAIEFALIFMFGFLPLLMLVFTGVMILAAQETLTLAAAEGARAALHYNTAISGRQTNACTAAQTSMQWLLAYAGDNALACGATGATGSVNTITVSPATACPSTPAMSCITVTTSYNYNAKPFIPGTKTAYGWVLGNSLSSSATVQLDLTGD